MSWDLVEATVEDAGTVAELMRQTFAEAYAALHKPADIETYCAEHYREDVVRSVLAQPDCCCVLARAQDRAMGFAVLINRRCDSRPDFSAQELKQIYVRSAAFGSGLGRRLMIACCQTLKRAGDSHLWLVVSNTNQRARRFYHRLGFTPAGAGPALVVGSESLSSQILISDVDALAQRLQSAAA